MSRIIMLSFLTAALLGGQNRVLTRIEFLRSVPVKPQAQLKTGSISGVIIGPNSRTVAGASVTALEDANDGYTRKSFSAVTVKDTSGLKHFRSGPTNFKLVGLRCGR